MLPIYYARSCHVGLLCFRDIREVHLLHLAARRKEETAFMAIFRITTVMDDERLREEIKLPLTDSCPIVVFAEEKSYSTCPARSVRVGFRE